MDAFPLATLEARRAAAGDRYLEFLTVPDLSAGLYVLEAGAVDGQQPHTEDEVYVVLEGRSRFTVGDATRDVGPGDTLFVAATVPHRFHDIAETLRIIVVLARRRAAGRPHEPARGSQPDSRTRSTRAEKPSARTALVPSSSWRKRT